MSAKKNEKRHEKTPMVKRAGFTIALGTAACSGGESEPTPPPVAPAMAPAEETPPAILTPVPGEAAPAELTPIPNVPALIAQEEEEADESPTTEEPARMRMRAVEARPPMVRTRPPMPPMVRPPMPPPPMVDEPPMPLPPPPMVQRAPMPAPPRGLEAPLPAPMVNHEPNE